MEELQVKSQIFKALGDERRLMILSDLATGEQCACDLLERLNITQPTLSHHMKTLMESGLVIGRKSGKWMYYSLSAETLVVAWQFLAALTLEDGGNHKEAKYCD